MENNDNTTVVPQEGGDGNQPTTPSVEEFNQLKQSLENLTGEIKDLRTAKATAEGERDAPKAKLEPPVTPSTTPNPTEDTMQKAVSTVLAELERKNAEKARERVEQQFKASHPEFSEGNDPAGLKYEAFKKTLGRFNLSGLSTDDEISQVYGDAYRLMGNNPQPSTSVANPYANDPQGRSTQPPVTEGGDAQLTAVEQKTIAGLGWTKERYLELKKKRPAYVQAIIDSSQR